MNLPPTATRCDARGCRGCSRTRTARRRRRAPRRHMQGAPPSLVGSSTVAPAPPSPLAQASLGVGLAAAGRTAGRRQLAARRAFLRPNRRAVASAAASRRAYCRPPRRWAYRAAVRRGAAVRVQLGVRRVRAPSCAWWRRAAALRARGLVGAAQPGSSRRRSARLSGVGGLSSTARRAARCCRACGLWPRGACGLRAAAAPGRAAARAAREASGVLHVRRPRGAACLVRVRCDPRR